MTLALITNHPDESALLEKRLGTGPFAPSEGLLAAAVLGIL
jgi:hypothetical protein